MGQCAQPVCIICGTALVGFGGALWNRSRYDRNVRLKLVRAAQRITEILQVPVVCFGHSHGATLQRSPNNHRAFYVNSGSFLTHEGHSAHAPDAPCDCIHTYIVLEEPRDYQYPKPQLSRWCHVTETGYALASQDAPNQR